MVIKYDESHMVAFIKNNKNVYYHKNGNYDHVNVLTYNNIRP